MWEDTLRLANVLLLIKNFPRFSILWWFLPELSSDGCGVAFLLRHALSISQTEPLPLWAGQPSLLPRWLICHQYGFMHFHFFSGLLFMTILKLHWCLTCSQLGQWGLLHGGFCVRGYVPIVCVCFEHFLTLWTNKILLAHLAPALPQHSPISPGTPGSCY